MAGARLALLARVGLALRYTFASPVVAWRARRRTVDEDPGYWPRDPATLPPARRVLRWSCTIRTLRREADGGSIAMADMDGSDRCSGRSLILTSMTMRSGAAVLGPRSGAMVTMTSTPACLRPTPTMILLAICRRAPRECRAPPNPPQWPVGTHSPLPVAPEW